MLQLLDRIATCYITLLCGRPYTAVRINAMVTRDNEVCPVKKDAGQKVLLIPVLSQLQAFGCTNKQKPGMPLVCLLFEFVQ